MSSPSTDNSGGYNQTTESPRSEHNTNQSGTVSTAVAPSAKANFIQKESITLLITSDINKVANTYAKILEKYRHRVTVASNEDQQKMCILFLNLLPSMIGKNYPLADAINKFWHGIIHSAEIKPSHWILEVT